MGAGKTLASSFDNANKSRYGIAREGKQASGQSAGVASIHDLDHEGFHLLIANLIRRVHVLQFLAVPKTVPGHQLGQAFPNDLIAL